LTTRHKCRQEYACKGESGTEAIGVIGMRLDQSPIRHDSMYGALIPVVSCGAVILAGVVPSALALTAKTSLLRRVILMVVIWGLLLVQIYLIFVMVLSGGH
jgi:hypothetical protein